MLKKSVAVIGLGGVGQITAASLIKSGFNVSLTTRSDTKIDELLRRRNKIHVHGYHRYDACIDNVDYFGNIDRVIHGKDIICMCIPANGHQSVAEAIAPHIAKNQSVVLLPGHTFGSLQVYNTIKAHRNDDVPVNFCVSEFQTSVLAALARKNIQELNHVDYLGNKFDVQFGTFPSRYTYQEFAFWDNVYQLNQLNATGNVLYPSLNNCNATVHPAMTIINSSIIDNYSPDAQNDTDGDTFANNFYFYKHGLSKNTANFVYACDNERAEICKKLLTVNGVGTNNIETVNEWLSHKYHTKCENLFDFFQGSEIHNKVKSPQTLDHRFLKEDITTGLIPLHSLGKTVGVDVSIIESIIKISKILVPNYNFEANARTLQDCDGHLHHLVEEMGDGRTDSADAISKISSQIEKYLYDGKTTSTASAVIGIKERANIERKLVPSIENEYNKSGMIQIGSIFDENEFLDIKSKVLSIYDNFIQSQETNVEKYLTNLHLSNKSMKDIVCCDKILDVVSSVIGNDIKVFSSVILCKEPNNQFGTIVPWHQDSKFWPIDRNHLNKMVSFWLAIDDITIDSGCVKFSLGSHKHGHYDIAATKFNEKDELFSPQLTESIPEKHLPKGSIVYNLLNAGEASLHHPMIPHCSLPNVCTIRLYMYMCFFLFFFFCVIFQKKERQQHSHNSPTHCRFQLDADVL